MTLIRCPKCGEEKDREGFYSNVSSRNGRSSYCKPCHNTLRRSIPRTPEFPRYAMLRGARYRARKAGIPFNLTLEDIIIPDECPVLGIPIRHRDGGKHGDDNSPQLDRIVPSFGYVKGNVMVISGRANRIKSDATYEELEVLTAFYRNYFNAIREAKAH